MSITKSTASRKQAPSGWDIAIRDAKRKIKELKHSIELFRQFKRDGAEIPEAMKQSGRSDGSVL